MPLPRTILTLVLKTRPISGFQSCGPTSHGCLYLGATADCLPQTALPTYFSGARTPVHLRRKSCRCGEDSVTLVRIRSLLIILGDIVPCRSRFRCHVLCRPHPARCIVNSGDLYISSGLRNQYPVASSRCASSVGITMTLVL